MGNMKMNEMSRAGLKLAQSIASIYADYPGVRAILVGGSVSRGCADEYSDLEIGVFWETPPTDTERLLAVRRMGGEVWKFESFLDGRRASEHIGLSEATIGRKRLQGTAMLSPIHLTVDTADEWIGELIDDLDTDPKKYELAAAVRYGIPLYGFDLLERWEKKVTSYPKNLAIKLVQQNLWLGPWFNWSASVERRDHLFLGRHLVSMQQSIVNILAALNREYVPSMEYKSVAWLLEGLHIKPVDCASLLRATFETTDQGQAVRELIELGMEVLDLVELHLPEVNEKSLFDDHPEVSTSWARRRWVPYPAYTLIDNIARSEG